MVWINVLELLHLRGEGVGIFIHQHLIVIFGELLVELIP